MTLRDIQRLHRARGLSLREALDALDIRGEERTRIIAERREQIRTMGPGVVGETDPRLDTQSADCPTSTVP